MAAIFIAFEYLGKRTWLMRVADNKGRRLLKSLSINMELIAVVLSMPMTVSSHMIVRSLVPIPIGSIEITPMIKPIDLRLNRVMKLGWYPK